MIKNFPQILSNLMSAFAASQPAQIAFFAGMFSFLLHIVFLHLWQSAALGIEPEIISQRFVVALMSPPEPNQPTPVIQPKSTQPDPAPKVIENKKPKAIPRTFSKALPVIKPLPKSIQNGNDPKPIKPNPLYPKHEIQNEPPTTISRSNQGAPGGSGSGYGIASQNGLGTGSGNGLGGGYGNGTGGGTGLGSGKGKINNTPSETARNEPPGFTKGIVVLERTEPVYPPRALKRGIEGHVTVEFIIKPNGEVSNLTIKNAEPSNIFNEAALTAIKKWKFKQKIVNGVAVEQRAIQTLTFKMK